MADEIKEVLIEKSVQPISIEKTKIILEQMEKCVCKIHINGKKGTGFFIKIPYKKYLLDALITNNHVLNDEKFEFGNTITLSLNNGKKIINIKIDDERKKYTNEILDITILEIKEIDGIKDFLSLDKRIVDFINSNNKMINEKFSDLYKNESIYILNYIKEIYVSYGILNDIVENRINHKCSTDDGSSGSPIILLESNEVIGVHYAHSKYNKDINFGTLIATPLIEFQNILNNIMIIRNKKLKKNDNSSKVSLITNNTKYNNINYSIKNQKNSINHNISQISIYENDIPVKSNNINNITLNSNEMEKSIQFNNLNDFSKIFEENPNQINTIIKETQTEINTSGINDYKENQEKNISHKTIIKYLIKLAYLKKELKLDKNLFENKLTKAYIINKNIIDKLMNIYNLKFNEMLFEIENNKKLNGISFQTFNDNSFMIREFINEILNSNKNKLEEEIQLSENENSLLIKHINFPVNCYYLDNFEIIDERFANNLSKMLKDIKIYPAYFGTIKNKNIFLEINAEQNFLYEIMSLNLDNVLIFEGLIEIKSNNGFYSNNLLKDYIFSYLGKNIMKSLVYKGNPIMIDNNNIAFNLYTSKSININTRNKNKSVKKENSNIFENSMLNSLYISQYKNELNKSITIRFKIIGNLTKEISIEIDKKMNELIFMFFKNIKKQELFNDNSIKFYHENELISHNSEDLIRNIFYSDNDPIIISVKDQYKKLWI